VVDVVSDQIEIDYAESTAQWSGDTFNLETEILVQGVSSVDVIQTANGANNVTVTKASGSWDMSGKHIRVYVNSNISANMITTNAMQIIVGDGTNEAIFTVAGKADYTGGWVDFFVDVDGTTTSGSVNSAAVTYITFRINTGTKPRNATNGWYDNWRFGNGIEINSDTTEAINFTDVAVEDALIANKYDIIDH